MYSKEGLKREMKYSIIVLMLFVGLIVFAASSEHMSVSGSKKYLSSIGLVKVDRGTLVYYNADEVITSRERRCLVRLTKHYELVLVHSLNEGVKCVDEFESETLKWN